MTNWEVKYQVLQERYGQLQGSIKEHRAKAATAMGTVVKEVMEQRIAEAEARAEVAEENVEVLNITLDARGMRLELLATRADTAEEQLAEKRQQLEVVLTHNRNLADIRRERDAMARRLDEAQGRIAELEAQDGKS